MERQLAENLTIDKIRSSAEIARLIALGARHYAADLRELGVIGNQKTLTQITVEALEERYLAKDDPTLTGKFYLHWGPNASVFDRYWRDLKPQITRIETKRDIPSQETFHTLIAAARIAAVLADRHVLSEQKARLLTKAGYLPKDTKEMAKKLTLSTTLSAINIIGFSSTVATAIAFGLRHPFLGDISEPTTQIWAFSTYLINYGAMLLGQGIQPVRSLEGPVHNSANVFATGAHYVLEKFLPSRPWLRRIVTGVIPIIPFVIEEAILIPSLLVVPSVAVSRNIGLGIYNLVQSIGYQAWIEKQKKPFH